MRRLAAIFGVAAALAFGSGQALAFQEEKPPPPEEAAEAATPQAPAMHLGTPAGAETGAQADPKGLKLFGYTVLPKLDFGLDVLYGKDERQLQLQGPSAIDDNADVGVLGKVKRRF
jgi:hypothetical protein